MFKILMVGSDSSVKGGITSVISQMLEMNWDSQNIDMKFIPTFISGNSITKLCFFSKSYIKIFQSIQRKDISVLYLHMSHNGSFFRKCLVCEMAMLFNVKTVVHLHSSEFVKFYENSNSLVKKMIQRFFKKVNLTIVLGKKWEERVRNIQPNANIMILHNTVSVPEISWDKDYEQVKLLFLGVLLQRKGVADLLKAIKELKNQQQLDSKKVKFIIAGTGQEEDQLKEYAKQVDIQGYVDFCGWVSGDVKHKLLEESHVLILPSYNEGLPICILEAMSYENAIIASNVGDVSAAVKDGVNGYLIEAGDINCLAQKINSVLSNKNLLVSMQKESRRMAEIEFSDTKYMTEIANACKSLVGVNICE